MMLITGLDNIREAQTVHYPKSADVYAAFPQYTKGYVHAVFNHKTGKWEYGYHETREDAIAFYDELKTYCQMMPDLFNWFLYSEMYIYSSHKSANAKWSLLGVVVEE